MSKIKTFGWIGRIRKVLGRNLKLSSGNTVDSQQIATNKILKKQTEVNEKFSFFDLIRLISALILKSKE